MGNTDINVPCLVKFINTSKSFSKWNAFLKLIFITDYFGKFGGFTKNMK